MAARRIAIVGGGLAGLTCARALQERGEEPVIFDKGRRAGGRISSRRGEDGVTFDHGAMWLDAGERYAARLLRAWTDAGVAARWAARTATVGSGGALQPGQVRECWVGAPRMSAVARWMAEGLVVREGCRVASLRREGQRWSVLDEEGASHGRFDHVVVAVPAPQAVPLVQDSNLLVDTMLSVTFDPCLVAMLRLETSLEIPHELLSFAEESLLSLAICDGRKPGRAAVGETWVLHARAAWSEAHLLDEFSTVAAALQGAFEAALGRTMPRVIERHGHCWRYSRVREAVGRSFVIDDAASLSVCGDGLLGPDIGDAIESGRALGLAL